jgi:hypothetical protein
VLSITELHRKGGFGRKIWEFLEIIFMETLQQPIPPVYVGVSGHMHPFCRFTFREAFGKQSQDLVTFGIGLLQICKDYI